MSTSPSMAATEFDPPPKPTTYTASAQLTSEEAVVYPQIILFGDSITQFSSLTFQPAIQTQYIRRLDVINRGFSGYTAPMGVSVLPRFLPVSTPTPSPPVKLVTVFFGANDACLPPTPQHVSLARYTEALTAIVNYPVFRAQSTALVLFTPPPIDEHQLGTSPRNAATTATYASAARELAASLSVPCLDVWSIFMALAGWTPGSETEAPLPGSISLPQNPVLAELLVDGLHLTPKAYTVLFRELMALIARDLPHLVPENLPYMLVDWAVALGGGL